MFSTKHFLVLLLLQFQLVFSYHTGAPKEACDDLVPGHGVDSQPPSQDHQLVLNKGNWNFHLGEKINFTLKLRDESRAQFKGFLIQVTYHLNFRAVPFQPTFSIFAIRGAIDLNFRAVSHRLIPSNFRSCHR